ncbi:hypothetical protein RB595_005418 [Gaeumannomyces hyphopodioides]
MELFNESHFPIDKNREDAFHPFPRLPVELRSWIWLHFLRRSRFIPIRIGKAPNAHGQSDYAAVNSLGKIISSAGRYYVCHYGSSLSPLLSVSSEARKAALDFYRVHLPLSYPDHPDEDKHPCLYMNPEHDVLAPIEFQDDTVRHWRPWNMASFLHDVRAYDPKDVGVVRLALRPNSSLLHYEHGDADNKVLVSKKLLGAIHPQAAASLRDILDSRLSTVFLLNHYILRDYYCRRVARPEGTFHLFTPNVLHGYPLCRHLESVTDFDWLEADPRPVEAEIKEVAFYADDPDKYFDGWRQVEKALGVRRQRPVDFWICPAANWRIASADGLARRAAKQPWRVAQPHTREGLQRFMDEERQELKEARDYVERLRLGQGMPASGSQEVSKGLERETQSVVGAWVLPYGAFSKTTERNRGGAMYDFSADRPGLIVFKHTAA